MADDINYIDDLYRRTIRKPEEVISIPQDYGPLQVDQSKILLEAYRQGLEPQIAQQKALEESVGSQIKAIGEMKSPERSDLADAIMLLGAPLLGALGGEAGALSAPKAYAGASDIYEKQLKAAEDKAAAKRKLGYERLEEDKKRLATLGTEIAKGRMSGGEKLADMEYKKTQAEEELKRAKIMAQVQQSLKPLTEGEKEGAARLGRAELASATLRNIRDENNGIYPSQLDKSYQFKLEQFARTGPLAWTTQILTADPQTRSQITAEMEWGANFLRDETGAVINASEIPFELNKYFAREGDTPDLVAKKEMLRKKVESGMRIKAGKAAALVESPKEPPKEAPPGMSFEEFKKWKDSKKGGK